MEGHDHLKIQKQNSFNTYWLPIHELNNISYNHIFLCWLKNVPPHFVTSAKSDSIMLNPDIKGVTTVWPSGNKGVDL